MATNIHVQGRQLFRAAPPDIAKKRHAVIRHINEGDWRSREQTTKWEKTSNVQQAFRLDAA